MAVGTDVGKDVVLVVGATGRLGIEIVRLLCAHGTPVRAVVRRESSGQTRELLARLGAVPCTADLKDLRSLEAACRGVATVVSTASAVAPRSPGDSIRTVDEGGQLDLVEAARSAGTGHFVFVSFPPVPLDFSLQRAKRAVEKRLVESRGMVASVVQPSKFSEVWLSPAVGFDLVNATVRIFGTGQRPVSWISLHDVARVIAEIALAGPTGPFAGGIIPIGGPQPLSPLEVVGLFERCSRRTVAIEFVPASVLADRLSIARDAGEEARTALALAMTHGQVIDSAPVRDLITWPMSTVADYVTRISSQIKREETVHG